MTISAGGRLGPRTQRGWLKRLVAAGSLTRLKPDNGHPAGRRRFPRIYFAGSAGAAAAGGCCQK